MDGRRELIRANLKDDLIHNVLIKLFVPTNNEKENQPLMANADQHISFPRDFRHSYSTYLFIVWTKLNISSFLYTVQPKFPFS